MSWCRTNRAQISRLKPSTNENSQNDPRDRRAIGELQLELGKVHLGLLARRSLEANLESRQWSGTNLAQRVG
jgi:hypothetical protein